MSLTLAPGISFCIADGARVFLDRNRDRYFSLGEAADAAFTSIGSRSGAGHSAQLDALLAAGILINDAHGECPRPCRSVELVSSPLDDDPHLAVAFFAALTSVASIRLAQRALSVHGLAGVCRNIEQFTVPARDARPIGPGDCTAIAARFARAKRIAGAYEQCLPIAIAMIRFCRGRRFAAQLVIGVRTRPFQAHAWVSTDGTVLTDQTAVAQQFTPILIL